MTRILEKAFSKASKLPPRDQTAIARWLMAELESDARWQQAFVNTGDKLAALADEALAEHRAGKTRRLGPKSL